MIFSGPARSKILSFAAIPFAALLLAGCMSMNPTPRNNVPVRIVGSQTLYPSAQRNPYSTPASNTVRSTNRTVSVSPYARGSNHNTTQVIQTRPSYSRPQATNPQAGTLEQQYRQRLAQQKPVAQPAAKQQAAAMPPPVLMKPLNNMSISDVIDSTIKNAPDLPTTQTVTTGSEAKEKPIETAKPTPSSSLPHQPSKQDIAKLGGDKPQFYWPVRGNVVSTYGDKGNGRKNDGINITAPKGTAVRAAANGLVVYSGQDLGGLGNLILVRHSGGFHTAYAHVDNVMVQTGDRVKANDSIATIGKSGNVTTPQLHFEIRDGKKSVNPDNYLPRS